MPWGNDKPNTEIKDTECKDVQDLTPYLALNENQRLGVMLQSWAMDRANLQDCKQNHDYQKEVAEKLNGGT